VIEKMLEKGIRFRKEETKGILKGLTFVFTGALSSFTRDEAKMIVEEQGGKTSTTVSQNVNIVVAGESAGSKLDKAKKLGIKVISEDEFLRMIKKE
jgi:DNA ligase (NAD+)